MQRFSTDHIGFARLRADLSLIRVGASEKTEFAAWRYGRRFASRRFRVAAHITSTTVISGGAVGLGTGLLLGAGGLALLGYGGVFFGSSFLKNNSAVVARLPISANDTFPVARKDLRFFRVLQNDSEFGWGLDTQSDVVFSDASMSQALALVTPLINRSAGSNAEQTESVRLIYEAGGSEGYLASLRKRRLEPISSWTRPERLALEMASNEEVERTVLEGELRLLHAAWREAELVAEIADGLLVPLPVEEKFRRYVTQHRSRVVATDDTYEHSNNG